MKNIKIIKQVIFLLSFLFYLSLAGCSAKDKVAGPALAKDDPSHKNGKVKSFEIFEVDLGDKAWGLNLLKVHVKNTTGQERPLHIHIGGRVPNATGFGMGDLYTIAPNDNRWIEHWYWMPPGHGSFDISVSFKEPLNISPPWKAKSFLVKTYPVSFTIPNSNCNNLTIMEKLPSFKKFNPDAGHLDPFEYFTTEHIVFYCSPNTLAYKDIKEIMLQHESALKNVCDFAGVSPKQKIAIFFYPDQATKKMCTLHTGDGLARGNMIAQVYNEQMKLDPYHELTHVVMGQIGNPPALFNEGFAVYMQTGHIWNGQHVDKTTTDLLKSGKLGPLSKLFLRTEIGSQNNDGEIAYPVSASFVKFLLDNYGRERFIKAYKKLRNNNTDIKKNNSYIEEVFGFSIDELEKQWHNFLGNSY